MRRLTGKLQPKSSRFLKLGRALLILSNLQTHRFLKKASIPFLLFLLFCCSVKAEDFPTLPLISLLLESGEVWEAAPVYGKTGLVCMDDANSSDKWLTVRLLRVLRSKHFKIGDTVTLNVGSYKFPLIGAMLHNNYNEKMDSVVRLMLFANCYPIDKRNRSKSPCASKADFDYWPEISLSGIRFLDQVGHVYIPWQIDNPGPYYFFVSDTSLTWEKFNGEVEKIRAEADLLLALLKIESPILQNQLALKWIKTHTDALKNGEWDWYEDVVFCLVLCNGYDEDAWAAIELYQQVFPGKMLRKWEWSYFFLPPDPFQSAQSAWFLWRKYKDTNQPIELRANALFLLNHALGGTHIMSSMQKTAWNKEIKMDLVLSPPVLRPYLFNFIKKL